jgi:hypothetical protein
MGRERKIGSSMKQRTDKLVRQSNFVSEHACTYYHASRRIICYPFDRDAAVPPPPFAGCASRICDSHEALIGQEAPFTRRR